MSTLTNRMIKTSTHKMRVVVESYASANEVAEDCKRRPITDSSFNDKSKQTFDSWEGVSSYEEALSLLRNGYQPTVEKLKEKMRQLKAGDKKRITFHNNVAGAVPVVPLAMMGVPNNMIDMRMTPIKCKVLDIYYDVACSAGTSSDQIIANGQKLLGAVMELEKQGYRFNIYAVQAYSDSKGVDILTVRVKTSSQPLDLKRISFPLTHTAFFRVIGFDWYSKCPEAKYRPAYGHALATEFGDEELNEFTKKVFGENSIYISGTKILRKGQEYIEEVLTNAGQKKRVQ